MNPYVKVNAIDKFGDDEVTNYNVVCITENFDTKQLYSLNKKARENKVGYILAETLGAAGYIFLDYGDEFIITDSDGEQTKSFIVTSATQDEKCVINVHEDKRHTYQDGDYVKFVEVEGMTELNNRDPVKISVNGPYSFKLDLDSREFGQYTGQGVVEDIKVP